jgi:hypothetical protein
MEELTKCREQRNQLMQQENDQLKEINKCRGPCNQLLQQDNT